jgi:outer membrane protein assembly factor BamE (lipoprotein component of BamABCDE complex)
MKYKIPVLLGFTLIIGGIAGCKTVEEHSGAINKATVTDRNLTVGVVQKEIRVGMNQGDVASVLGSPNIVSRDDADKETWIYDKIATEAYYSSSEGGAGINAGGGGLVGKGLILGGVGANYSESTGAKTTTQKTLTVVIKFNKAQKVESFTYHTSKF